MYHALAPGAGDPVHLIVHMRGTPAAAFAGRLRALTAAVDPMLRLESVVTLDEVVSQDSADQVAILILALVTGSVVLLSAAGIYALMSCTVSLRRREIGIRSALGAGGGRLIRGVLAKAARQIAIGIGTGTAIAALIVQSLASNGIDLREVILLLAVAGFMMGVGLLAAVGPVRRALRIEPTEALKTEV
jgi:ABC-type antimicrobial peptide transport system permease subunit